MQFVIVRIKEGGERIPLTIADYDRDAGILTIVVQEVGTTTIQFGELEEGDDILDDLKSLIAKRQYPFRAGPRGW